jgi:hypothetical protein
MQVTRICMVKLTLQRNASRLLQWTSRSERVLQSTSPACTAHAIHTCTKALPALQWTSQLQIAVKATLQLIGGAAIDVAPMATDVIRIAINDSCTVLVY